MILKGRSEAMTDETDAEMLERLRVEAIAQPDRPADVLFEELRQKLAPVGGGGPLLRALLRRIEALEGALDVLADDRDQRFTPFAGRWRELRKVK